MSESREVYVWDPVVRWFHWTMVVTFTFAYFTGEGDETLHAYAGYVVLGLVLLRIVWGFIGTRHARFSDFIYPPGAIVDYFRGLLRGRPGHYLGHNPAGGVMVIILLLSLLAISWSGLKVYGIEGHGPLAGDISVVATAQADDDDDDEEEEGVDGAAEEYWEDLHEATVNFTLVLVFIHIIAVIVSSVFHQENLVRAMITGRKPQHTGDE